MPPQETPQPFSSNLVLSTMGWNNFWCQIIISTWYLLQKYLDKNSSCIRSNCKLVAFCLTAYGKPHVISTAQQNGINFFSSIKTNTKLLTVGAHTSWQSLGCTRAFDHTPPHAMCLGLQNNVLTSACNVRVCYIFLDLQSAITISKNFAVNLFTSRNRHYCFAL